VTLAQVGDRHVGVLRVARADDALARELGRRGLDAVELLVGTVADRPVAEVRAAVGDVAAFRWAAVTSRHAVSVLAALGPWPPATRVAAVGPATAALARAQLGRCDAVAPGGTAASLAGELDTGPVLFVAAATARDDLETSLRARGVPVTRVTGYDVEPRRLDTDDVRRLAACELLVAMSPRAIDALCELDAATRATVMALPLVVIGPTTESRATSRNFAVSCRAEGRDAASVADAVTAVLAR
jgi:uroporphyrinogen-III synthase